MVDNRTFRDDEIPDCLTNLASKSSFKINNEPLDLKTFIANHESRNGTPARESRHGSPRKTNGFRNKPSRISPSPEETEENRKNDNENLDGTPGDQTTRRAEAIRHKKPLKYCVFIARFPILSFLLTSLFHISVLGSTFYLVFTGYDVFPINFEELPLILHTDIARTRDLAFREKDQYSMRITRPIYGVRSPNWYNGWLKDIMEIIMETDGADVYSKENMQLLATVEDKLWNMDYYRYLFCFKNERYSCEQPTTILRFFDGTYSNVSSVFDDPNYDNIKNVLCTAYNMTETTENVQLFLEKNYNPCTSSLVPTKTRMFFKLGTPLRSQNSNERTKVYLDKIARVEFESIRDGILKDKMSLYYISTMLFEYDVTRQALKDMLLAVGSFAFIVVFMWIQTGTLWITFMGILSIITSFLMTNLIYRFVLGYKYFGFFHIISMFIILGIGADDVFIFYDTWKLTGTSKYPTPAHRLSDCYRKAAKTTFVTSVTTMAAFLVSGMSPLLPVSSFGIFSGLLVGVNFLCDLLYFPTVIMMYHSRIKPFCHNIYKCFTCCCRKSDKKESDVVDESSDSSSPQSSNRSNSLMSEPGGKTYHDATPILNKIWSTSEMKLQPPQSTILEDHSRPTYDRELSSDSEDTVGSTEDPFDSRPASATNDTLDPMVKFENTRMRLAREQTKEESFFFKRPSVEWTSSRELLRNKHGLKDESDIKRKRLSVQWKENVKPETHEEDKEKLADTEDDFDSERRREFAKLRKRRRSTILENGSRIANFLKNKFFDFLTLKANSFIIPILFLSVTVFFMYNAASIEPDSKKLQIYKSSHNYAKASSMHYYSFQKNFEDEYTSVYLVWGINPNDMSTCDLKTTTPYCIGRTSYDDNFDGSSAEAQTAFKDLCDELDLLTDIEADSYKIKINPETGKREIQCFTTALESFIENDIQTNHPLLTNATIVIPYDKDNVTLFMQANPHIYNMSGLPASYDGYLEIAIAYWLTNKYTAESQDDYWKYSHLLGEERITGTTQQALNSYSSSRGMYYGTKMKYMAIQINTTMSVYTLGYLEGKPIQEKWEAFINRKTATMPATMQNGFQVTTNTWHWIKVQETLVNSAIQGVVIGLSVALPILILTTMNVIIGFLATVVISLITACIIGMIPLAGWKLGVLESLNLCMVVGLSVDYVVHLAEAYATSPSDNRMGRVRHMLESMGISVISGAVTTFGASIFLLFSEIQFLYQFGIFVMSIVSTSLIFSLFGFTTCMALCGPQGNTGSLKELFRKIKTKCCCGTKKQSIDESKSCCLSFALLTNGSPGHMISDSATLSSQTSSDNTLSDTMSTNSTHVPMNTFHFAQSNHTSSDDVFSQNNHTPSDDVFSQNNHTSLDDVFSQSNHTPSDDMPASRSASMEYVSHLAYTSSSESASSRCTSPENNP